MSWDKNVNETSKGKSSEAQKKKKITEYNKQISDDRREGASKQDLMETVIKKIAEGD